MARGAAPERDDVVSVAEAAAMLGVKPATVYAYVSRGYLTSIRGRDDRKSRLSRSEVEQFAHRRGTRPAGPAARVVRAAGPEEPAADRSEVGGIIGGRLVYRGRDAVELAGSAAYAEVAELLWSGLPGPGGFATLDPGIRALLTRMSAVMPEGCLPLDRLKAAAAVLGATDPLRYDLSRPAVVSVARTLAPAFVEALPIPDGCADDPAGDLVARLWVKLAGARPSPAQLALLTGALILLADHGVGPSTRAVREAAARQADPYSAVLAGTSVAAGLLHGGGSSLAVQAWLEEIGSVEAVPRALADRLVRGDRISGFGQPRYPGADPRAVRMMQLLDDSGGRPERLRIVHQVIDLVRSRRSLDPNAEFALGAMCFVHGMPRGAGEAVFVIARSAGWIAHAIEEYDRDGGAGGTLPRG